jgi:hypothetical protein
MSNDISNPQPLIPNTAFSMDWFGQFQVHEETVTIPSHWMTVDLNVIAQALGFTDIVSILGQF